MTHEDWPHQTKGIREIFEAFDEGARSVCFQLATGGGKSRVIRRVTERYHDQKRCVYLVTHRKSLVRQLADELREAGIFFSVVQPGFPNIDSRIKVCSLMTLVNRAQGMQEPELILIDEFHHAACASYAKLMQIWPRAKILGFTATPQRPDGRPLVCDRLILGPPPRDLIRLGVLCDFAYYAPEDMDRSDVPKNHGEFAAKENERKTNRSVITGSAIKHYRQYANHQPAIVSCVSIKHAEDVAIQFRGAGYKAVAVHSKMPDEAIRAGIDGLKTGKVEVLCQCSLIDEGVNIPGARVLIMLAMTASIVRFLQLCGRVLRGQLGKIAIILDHVSNYKDHGMPDDPREWNPAGEAKQERGRKDYKRCPGIGCLRPVPVQTRRCPYCGYEWPESERELPQEVEGRLINIREQPVIQGLEHVVTAQKAHKRECAHEILRTAQTREKAEEIAERYGYKPGFGWFVMQNRSRFRRKTA